MIIANMCSAAGSCCTENRWRGRGRGEFEHQQQHHRQQQHQNEATMKTMNAMMMEEDDEADEDIAGPNPAGSDAILNHHLWNRDKSNLPERRPQIVVCKLLRKHRRR